MWIRLSIFTQLSIIQYIWGSVFFSLPIPLVMIERIYTLSYYHHQIGSMNYYPLFRARSWNNGTRCMYIYILRIQITSFISGIQFCASLNIILGTPPAFSVRRICLELIEITTYVISGGSSQNISIPFSAIHCFHASDSFWIGVNAGNNENDSKW